MHVYANADLTYLSIVTSATRHYALTQSGTTFNKMSHARQCVRYSQLCIIVVRLSSIQRGPNMTPTQSSSEKCTIFRGKAGLRFHARKSEAGAVTARGWGGWGVCITCRVRRHLCLAHPRSLFVTLFVSLSLSLFLVSICKWFQARVRAYCTT